MSQIKITVIIEASAFSLAHSAVDAMDAKLRQHGGRVVSAKIAPAKPLRDGAEFAGAPWVSLNVPSRWTVLYTRIPTSYNNQQKLIVEAPTEADAYKVANRHIGDEGKTLSTYHIESVRPYVPELVAGRVVGGET